MTLDYNIKGQVTISMKDYIDKMIKEVPYQEEIKKMKPNTLAAEHLFKVSKSCNKFSTKEKEQFHIIVAQGLFLCKRAMLEKNLAI